MSIGLLAKRLSGLPPAQQAEALAALEFLSQRSTARVDGRFYSPSFIKKARTSLSAFAEAAFAIVEPGITYRSNWHIERACHVLEAVTRGELRRVIFNIPPGTMKSLLIGVFWPAWEWGRDPRLKYLTASYSAHLSIRDNVRLRDIVQSEWYERCFWNADLAKQLRIPEVRLKGDQNEKVRFDTTARGWRIASSVEGKGTGEHPDRFIIDDPHTAEQARSEKDRERVRLWMKRTVSSRGVSRKAAVVIVMQRLHELDLSGVLLEQGGWEHVMFPMRFEQERADKRDPRTEEGELLWPDLFPEEAVRQLELDLDPYGVAGQLQQRPSPEGGGLFRREWFTVVDAAPVEARRCRGWDTGSTPGGGDYTAGVKLSVTPDGVWYVEDVVRGQWGPSDVDGIIMQVAAIDGRGCRIREEKEPGSAGASVIAARARALVGYDYAGVPITGDKATRARPFRAQCEAGNVRLVRGEWNSAYLDEMEHVFTGAHDDQADASSCAFNELALGVEEPRTVEVRWG